MRRKARWKEEARVDGKKGNERKARWRGETGVDGNK